MAGCGGLGVCSGFGLVGGLFEEHSGGGLMVLVMRRLWVSADRNRLVAGDFWSVRYTEVKAVENRREDLHSMLHMQIA